MFVDKGMHKTLGDLLGSLLDSSENHMKQLVTSTHILSIVIVCGRLIHRNYMQHNMLFRKLYNYSVEEYTSIWYKYSKQSICKFSLSPMWRQHH